MVWRRKRVKEEIPETRERMRVSKHSDSNKVAEALKIKIFGSEVTKPSGILKGPQMDVIGAGALNQAIKAQCILRGDVLLPKRIELYFRPAFQTVEIQGQIRTALALRVDIEPLT